MSSQNNKKNLSPNKKTSASRNSPSKSKLASKTKRVKVPIRTSKGISRPKPKPQHAPVQETINPEVDIISIPAPSRYPSSEEALRNLKMFPGYYSTTVPTRIQNPTPLVHGWRDLFFLLLIIAFSLAMLLLPLPFSLIMRIVFCILFGLLVFLFSITRVPPSYQNIEDYLIDMLRFSLLPRKR
jgi:hypothetical protein